MSGSSKTLSAVAAAVVVAGLASTAGAAGAAPISSRAQLPVLGPFTFTSATQSLASSTHKHLRIDLFATDRPTAGTEVEPNSMTITVARRHAPERHTWVFELPRASDFSYDEDTRTGALRTGSAIKPFGALSLTLTAVGREKSVGCGRTRANNQRVKVTGTMSFDTRSKGKTRWGAVGGRHRMTFTGHSIISVLHPADKLCGSFLPPCVTTKAWLAHKTTPAPPSPTTR
jgi:hypothetical protein